MFHTLSELQEKEQKEKEKKKTMPKRKDLKITIMEKGIKPMIIITKKHQKK